MNDFRKDDLISACLELEIVPALSNLRRFINNLSIMPTLKSLTILQSTNSGENFLAVEKSPSIRAVEKQEVEKKKKILFHCPLISFSSH